MTDIILSENRTNETNNVRQSSIEVMFGQGDSMSAHFNHGDPIQVDTSINKFIADGVYVWMADNRTFISMLQSMPDSNGDRIRVSYSNPDYPAWFMPKDLNYQIIGMVKKAWRSKTL
ncbi:MAG: helix-turn-helix transcriptional regulator [Methylophaga sp.]|uniref:S24 family peptidase n=1 Tax=Methylophaga sp. TaxID=2024840 RepID=UPI000C0DB769|nr:S24 family peptidase [Methylophaga sp.]MBL1456923.1 helix-turn-helix transcriptional regulator [Methylophaga sp.]